MVESDPRLEDGEQEVGSRSAPEPLRQRRMTATVVDDQQGHTEQAAAPLVDGTYASGLNHPLSIEQAL